ncbi:MAG: helix-turn-helix domain-containing protein [Magnetococcales bacterium]|nr:helix-turn-helix domain-containing protein [Magnetococcales bacterium]
MTLRHMNQIDLSRRWGISHRTLERWRSLGTGPAYIKIGGRVAYRLEDIERYEASNLHSGSMPPASSQSQGAAA